MRQTTLVDTNTLATHLSDAALVVIDCRFDLAHPDAGERDYQLRHIPGAVYAHLDRDLSGVKTGTNGRHPLPDPQDLSATFSRLGIDARAQVVAYDADTGMFASRLWWMLRWLGHDGIAVLDGGFKKWLAENRPTRSGMELRAVRHFVGHPRHEMVATFEDVAAIVSSGEQRLIDARAPERFRGDIEPLDPVAGHIPGAVNHHFKWNLDQAGQFRSADELRSRLRETAAGTPPERIVCYCGSGVTACHNLLALEHAGLHGARLYPGSWSEWAAKRAGGAGRSGRAGR